MTHSDSGPATWVPPSDADMTRVHIQRSHDLGLDGARALLDDWVSAAESQWGLTCVRTTNEEGETVHFSRTGFAGEARLTAHELTLTAQLGFLLSPYAARIEQGIRQQIDARLRAAPDHGPISAP